MTATLTLQGETYFSGDRVPHIHVSESALNRFTGNYHSDELEATYKLSLVKGILTLKNGNQTPVNLHPVGANEFQAGDLGTIVFHVAGNHHVFGLTLVLATRTRHHFRESGLIGLPEMPRHFGQESANRSLNTPHFPLHCVRNSRGG